MDEIYDKNSLKNTFCIPENKEILFLKNATYSKLAEIKLRVCNTS